MKVYEWVEVRSIEVVNRLRMLFRYMHEPHVFSYDRSVLPFDKRIVVCSSRAALRLVDQELLQELCHHLVDVLTPIVGVEV